MSYEGYEQHLCSIGHYFTVECSYSYDDDEVLCPVCKNPSAFCNAVDETNCEAMGKIDMDVLLVFAAKSKTCDMGHEHVTQHAVYRIPSEEERNSLQTYRNDNGDIVFLEFAQWVKDNDG